MISDIRNFFAVLFFGLFAIFISYESYDFFFNDGFFEGYMVAVPVIIFIALLLVLLLPLFVFKIEKGPLRLLIASILGYGIVGMFGFTIPLIILPIASILTTFYFLKMSIKKAPIQSRP